MLVDEHVYVQGTNKYLLMIHIFNVYVSRCMHILYSQNYWLTLYLMIYTKNAIDGILNWQF